VPGVQVNGQALRVNRTVIKKGDVSQLVYYWFQQRGRIIANEYLLHWYWLRDAVTNRRTDGSLVRLTTLIPPNGNIKAADARLEELSRLMAVELQPYVPN